jgi:Cyanobactin oxidase ThcOx,
VRAPAKKQRRRTTAPAIAARLLSHITLETTAEGDIAASFGGYSVALGRFSTDAVTRAQELRIGLSLGSFATLRRPVDKEIDLLVRRVARRGLLEYRFGHDDTDLVVIEPQIPDYWPQMPKLGEADSLVLSRFAYLRRRGNEMVLESPRVGG